MSNAKPMTNNRRVTIYYAGRPDNAGQLTARQYRQLERMGHREHRRMLGQLSHGASGAPVRKPIVRTAARLSGSIVTHVAYYCPPCPKHAHPRLHRRPR